MRGTPETELLVQVTVLVFCICTKTELPEEDVDV